MILFHIYYEYITCDFILVVVSVITSTIVLPGVTIRAAITVPIKPIIEPIIILIIAMSISISPVITSTIVSSITIRVAITVPVKLVIESIIVLIIVTSMSTIVTSRSSSQGYHHQEHNQCLHHLVGCILETLDLNPH